jgi:hypothetical protein
MKDKQREQNRRVIKLLRRRPVGQARTSCRSRDDL